MKSHILSSQAASGIGRETALAFAEAGAKGVIFADINLDGAQKAADESKQGARHVEYCALAIQLDIANDASVQSLVAAAVNEFGRIDYAVNSAGVDLEKYQSFTPALDIDVFDKSISINVRGAALFVRSLIGVMSKQEPPTYTGRYGTRTLGRGSIVLLGSLNSLVPAPGMFAYTTGKHAILGIMKSAAVDALALQSGIRVNAVCPGFVDTPMAQECIKVNPVVGQAIAGISPLKRAAFPDEVADYIVFLSSPSASFINGTALPIDSGLSLPAPPPSLLGE
ncbi:hypothetical protein N0V93_004125 [Gnomoniopsis smithogilvyi]|uniref:Uncharacterized protein n=1 Tax=Gnomoniopsis smithogilvyi TaxID=1191159 RepID=A0A9W8YXY4_9PEZI|nr:hypothetical protein N0V93_004125 [Gnomoniopsis smithogilvyi]